MKFKFIFTLIIISALLFGCKNPNVDNNNLKENNMTTNFNDFSCEENLIIYKISNKTLDNLLEDNCFETISNNADNYHCYSTDGKNYITYDVLLFQITNEFINFINDKSSLNKFLADNDIKENIEYVVVFEAPYTPISIWIKTAVNTHFITVNEDYEDNNIYKLYSQSDYIEKYKGMDYQLTIDNELMENSENIKVYNKYADFPFFKILNSLGAEIKKHNSNVSIIINGKTYILDTENNKLYKKLHKKDNIFSMQNGGGPHHMYMLNDEYYIDNDTLQFALQEMGIKIDIQYYNEKSIVNITEINLK